MASHNWSRLVVVVCAGLLFFDTTFGYCQSVDPTYCQKGFVIYFGNGIDNTAEDAFDSLDATINVLGFNYDSEPIVEYRLALNPTTGLSGDLYRVLQQLLAQNTNFTGYFIAKLMLSMISTGAIPQTLLQYIPVSEQAAIQNDFNQMFIDLEQANGTSGGYYDGVVAQHVSQYEIDLNEGRKVLVVAHSQGNLYANAAYDRMVADGMNMQAFAIASVATPADFAKSGQYVTSTNDLIIAAVRQVSPALAANVTVGITGDDPLGHSYLNIYLNAAHEAYTPVVAMFNSLLRKLLVDAASLSPGPLVATLTWTTPGDMDLHIFEPQGTHVYYANKQGLDGYLDRDDTTGTGPEHYFTSCASIQPGVYKFGINYYRGMITETGTIVVRAFNQAASPVSIVLSNSLGSAGNANPTILVTVTLAKDPQTGALTVQSIQ